VIAKESRKIWKPIDARRMALLTNVCTVIHEVRANASGNYIHREIR
jgi:hypothetical protein